MVARMRAGQPFDEVIFWDGTRIAHPPERGGLAEAVVELRTQAVVFARRVGTVAAVAGGICAVAAVALIVRRAVR